MSSEKVAKNSIMITLCLVLSYIEVLIPFNFAIPGVKLGLSNIVVLYALYNMDIKTAFFVNLIRILVTGLLFSNPITMIYSATGGIFSFFGMILIKKVKILSVISVSVTGAVFHNIGQIVSAYFLLGSAKIIYYLPVLLILALLTGFFTGYISAIVIERTRGL